MWLKFLKLNSSTRIPHQPDQRLHFFTEIQNMEVIGAPFGKYVPEKNPFFGVAEF